MRDDKPAFIRINALGLYEMKGVCMGFDVCCGGRSLLCFTKPGKESHEVAFVILAGLFGCMFYDQILFK